MQPMPRATKVRRTRLEDLRVCDLMTPSPVSLRHGLTLREAATFLSERGIGAAPVVNDAGRAVGVLSRTDILLAVNAGLDGAPVREAMSPGVIAVQSNADALQASEVMTRCVVRRVFVVDDDGVPVGVVSVADLFRGLMTLWGEAPAPAA